MSSSKKDGASPTGRSHATSMIVFIVNCLLLVCAIFLYGRYTILYQDRLRQENLSNISNLNQSAAFSATAMINSWKVKLDDVCRFAEVRGLSVDEALRMLEDANSSNTRSFELISRDYTGYLAKRDDAGAFIPVDYSSSAYADLRKALDDTTDAAYADVCFAPEFTDSHTALKYFALYKHLTLLNRDGVPESYALMLAGEARGVLAVFNIQSDYEGQSSVLMEETGNYIVSNGDFKSSNFFQYLYVYNDLSLDQRRAIRQEIAQNGSGELYYKNGAGKDCVFRYERMTTNNWYCVTCVPLSSFRAPTLSTNYAIYAVLALLVMMAMDLLWLRHMNRQLRTSMLREKEASEAKTDFLSRMSHDIRTPLNGIIGLTTLALDEFNPPRTKEYLENIRVSGQFLTGLVNDILDMSKVESGKVELHPEPYSCTDLYKYVEAVISPLCYAKGISFRMEPPDGEPPVMLDRLRFNQVMFNLLSNAVKYTPQGGRVELEWAREELANGRVALDVTVRDNGIGMSEEFQRHMFETFSQERAQTGATGSGLGLAIVQSLVGLMNGRIEVQSKQGEGTVFIVRLETEISREKAAKAEEARGAALENRHVLLCEDNRINVLVVTRLLEKWGMTIDVAMNGREGVERFAASEPWTYDIVLMDVMMPEMNGLDATRAIRALDRPDAAQTPILAMTANAYDADVQNCLDAGMNAHMGKPIDAEQLQELLSKWIGKELEERKANGSAGQTVQG